MLTYMFPGQGAQRKGMGAEVFARFPGEVQQANEWLGYDLRVLCEQDDPRLHDTAYTQPALFVVTALMDMELQRRTGVRPDFVIGHSLGEYNALLHAGVIDFDTGLRLVAKRGELMARQNGMGGMIAVLDPDRARLDAIADSLGTDFCIANDNAPAQVVCSGSTAALDRAGARITAEGVGKVVPLKVSGAFHSHFMKDAAREFQTYCRSFEFRPARIPVIANLTARPHEHGDWPTRLSDHLTHPVRWRQSLDYLRLQGPMLFQEVGPGNVLTSLARGNLHIH